MFPKTTKNFLLKSLKQGEKYKLYKFGPYCLNMSERFLLLDEEVIPLPPKAFEILVLLVANSGYILRKNDLLEVVWSETYVEENNLSQYISFLRKALGNDQNGQPFIETVPKLGYRFVANVVEEIEDEINGLPESWANTSSHISSVAVLPFKFLDHEESNDYLAIGIADAIITKLGNLKQILVRPTSLVRKYTDLAHDAVLAGRELRVEIVLEGIIQKLEDKIRTTVQLVSVRDQKPLWSDKFDVDFKDIFTVEDLISEKVAETLISKLTSEERKSLSKRYTDNIEAYQLYLKGRYYWNKRNSGGLKNSKSYFQQAIDKDPLYALAYAGLADCYNLHSYYGELSPRESFPKAKAAAARAIEIDNNLAEAHTSLAFVKAWYDWDWSGAEREFKQALELNPDYATAHHWYAIYLMAIGRNDEAMEEITRAYNIDPLSLAISRDVGLLRHFGEPQSFQAIEQYLKTIELDQNFWAAHRHLGLAYLQNGMYKESIAELKRAIAIAGNRTMLLAELGHAYAVSGLKRNAIKIIGDLKKRSAQEYVSSYDIALIYVGLNLIDNSFECLQNAYTERASWLIYLKVEPMLARLRTDGRFTDLLQQIGLTSVK